MATLKKIRKGQTVTEQVDLINENVENINVDLEKVVNNEAGYVTSEEIPVKSVNSKTGDVSLSAKDVGAFPNSSSIKELDINNIKDTGVYIGTYATNPYYLIVIKYNDTNIYQELIGAKFKEYRRFTGTWSEWVKEYSTENPVKAGDIKGIEIVDTDKELSLALLEDTTFVKADIKYNPSSKSLYIGDEKFATEQFVRDAVNMVKSIIVAELPETGIANTIYFVPSANTESSNAFEEYIYVNGEWEIVGGTSIDLTPFLPREEAEKTYAKISSLDEKVSKTTTINGKTLYNNINLTAEDVGALPKDTILVEDVVYRHTNEEISGKLIAGAFVENDLVIAIDDGTYLKGHMYKYNSGTLTDITDIITDYVDLNSDQNINGTKNFNGILRYGGVNVLTEDDLVDYVTKTGFTMRASSTVGKFYYNTGAGEKSIQVKMPTIPDTSGFVPNTRTVNGKELSSDISLGNKDVGALPDYTLTINHGTAGNPRMVKFASVNYTSAATCFKMGAMTCHDNGVSYQFLTDMLIAVTAAGEVTANIYKFAQSSVGNVDGVARYTGDVFYVNDTASKIVDFYILCGQYSSSQFTPATKVGSTTISYVTQYSGTATYYSSGDKVWANGCGTTYARMSDLNSKLTGTKVDENNPNIFIGYNSEENLNSFYQVAFKENDQAKGICWSKFANISNGAEVNGVSSTRTPSGCTNNGFYYVTSSTNSLSGADANPFLQYHTSNNDFRILTTAYSDIWLQQIATDFRTPYVYVRRRENGTWYNWEKLAMSSDLGTQATFSLSGTTLTITPK